MGSKEIAEPIRGNVKDMYEMKRQQYKLELEKKEQRLKTNFISKVSLSLQRNLCITQRRGLARGRYTQVLITVCLFLG